MLTAVQGPRACFCGTHQISLEKRFHSFKLVAAEDTHTRNPKVKTQLQLHLRIIERTQIKLYSFTPQVMWLRHESLFDKVLFIYALKCAANHLSSFTPEILIICDLQTQWRILRLYKLFFIQRKFHVIWLNCAVDIYQRKNPCRQNFPSCTIIKIFNYFQITC